MVLEAQKIRMYYEIQTEIDGLPESLFFENFDLKVDFAFGSDKRVIRMHELRRYISTYKFSFSFSIRLPEYWDTNLLPLYASQNQL